MKKKTKLISNNTSTILIFILILIYSLSTSIAISQPQQEWVSRYNSSGSYDDYVQDMALDDSGNVYLTGYIYYTSSNSDFLTIKYNTTGTQQWVKTYDGPYQGDDKANTIALDKQGNVYVSGESQNIYGKKVYGIVKYSNNGTELWSNEYINEDSSFAIARAMTIDDSGSVYVTGSSWRSMTSSDFTTVKFNTNGVFQWVKYYGGTANVADIPYAITTDRFYNVFVTGSIRDSGNIGPLTTIRYNSEGSIKWISKYSIGGKSERIFVDNFGYSFIGGYIWGGTQNQNDFLILCYDSLGNKEWEARYNSMSQINPNDYLRDMVIDDSSNVYITGISASSQNGWDYTTLKYNRNGDSLWIRRYKSAFNSNDEPNSISLDKYRNVYVTGKVDSNFLWYRYRTVRYSPNGVQDWAFGYNSNSPFLNHEAVKVKTDTLGNIYVTGNSEGNGTGMDIATIKYSNPTYVHQKQEETPGEYELFQNYPNPFNSQTTIEFYIKEKNIYILEIYDLLGRKREELLNKNLNIGSYKITYIDNELSSGVYFYRLCSDKINITKSFILIK